MTRLALPAGQERLLNAIVRHGGFQHLATAMGLNYITKPHKWTDPGVMATPPDTLIECAPVEAGSIPPSVQTSGQGFEAGLEPRLVSGSVGREEGAQRSSRVLLEPAEAPQLQQLSIQVLSFLRAANGERSMEPGCQRFPTGHQLKAAGTASRHIAVLFPFLDP